MFLLDAVPENVLVALAGLGGGVLLGLAARMGRFCTLGAIEDALYAGDFRRARMWALALAGAILGVALLAEASALDLGDSIYAQRSWSPLASIVGGLVFGYGMAIAGACGYGALARCGGGDLRALVIVVVAAVSAYATLGGPLGVLRVALFPPGAPLDGLSPNLAEIGAAHGIAALLGVSPLLPAAVAALGLAAWALRAPAFRRSRGHVVWSLAVAAAIVSGWWGTSWVAAHGFEATQVESHNFMAPLGETLLYIMTSTGGGLSFSVGSVAGVIAGAALGSLWLGEFRWEACDDARELGRQILGAALMGAGGVVAVGCSIGQGLTAFSMLAYSAPVTLAAIVLGAALGLRHLIEGLAPSN